MKLTLQEKAEIAYLFEESKSWFRFSPPSLLKIKFLRAYAAVWNQTNPVVREKIAAHYAKKLMTSFGYADKKKFPNLEAFFTQSIMAFKVDKSLFSALFFNAKMPKNFALATIKEDYEQPTAIAIKESFKLKSPEYKEAERIAKANWKTLNDFVANHPHQYFDEKKGNKFTYRDVSGISVFLSIFIACLAYLNINEDENSLQSSLILSFIPALLWTVVLNLHESWLVINAMQTSVHFNLVDSEEESEVIEPKKARKTEEEKDYFPATLSLVIESQKTVTVTETINEIPRPIIPIKSKRKEIKNISDEKIDKSAEEKTLTTESIHPDFFGEQFKALGPDHIVLVDPGNLGRHQSYFAIWNKPCITQDIKDPADWDNHDELFKIFRQGNLASQEGTSGIKRLRGLGFFEIKKADTAYRAFGEQTLCVKGKTAIVFDHYKRTGFHNG